jgi:oxygen-dependent protoporphyrinogen oxidase
MREPTHESATLDLVVGGAGISGLTFAQEILRRRPGLRIAVLEAQDRPGGTMGTDRVGGCLAEWGPNGFLTNVTDTLQLADRLDLGARLLPASPRAQRRFLWVRNALREVDPRPGPFLRNDLLSLPAKLRLFLGPFRPRARDGTEDSIHSFARRRIGREAAEVLVDAMVTGIYAGDPARLSLRACFPKMEAMEREHGSLVRAMLAKQRQARRARKTGPGGAGPVAAGPAGPGGVLTSFDEGMGVLAGDLAGRLGDRIRYRSCIRSISPLSSPGPGGARYRITVQEREGARTLDARRLVLAVPAHAAAGILAPVSPRLAACVGSIPYAGLTVVCLVYDRGQIPHPLDGFGYLVPRREGARILGCIWTGSVFPAHVAEGKAMLRVMLGGARDPEAALLPEGKTVDIAHGEVSRMLGGIRERPAEARLYRYARGIPQYEIGHPGKLEAIEADLSASPGLHLLGNAYRGIGVNDCVREAVRLADRLAAEEPSPSGKGALSSLVPAEETGS